MSPRKYFYKNSSGEVVPYHYCSECGKQFTNEEFNVGLIVNVGSKTTPIKYCAKPCLSLKFSEVTSKRQHVENPDLKIEKFVEAPITDIPNPEIPESPIIDIPNPEIPEELLEEIPQENPPKENPLKNLSLEEELRKLTARQIVEKVKKEKGVTLLGSLKSKIVFIKKALKLYA